MYVYIYIYILGRLVMLTLQLQDEEGEDDERPDHLQQLVNHCHTGEIVVNLKQDDSRMFDIDVWKHIKGIDARTKLGYMDLGRLIFGEIKIERMTRNMTILCLRLLLEYHNPGGNCTGMLI